MPSVRRDPAVLVVTAILWVALILFVLFPLGTLLARTFTDDGRLTLAPLLAILRDANHRQAFANSLLLATLVGAAGTALGFLFAYTAVRARLGSS